MKKTPFHHQSSTLAKSKISRHGFFSRIGGHSTGIFHSLNTGPGSSDNPAHIESNRALCTNALKANHLITLYQIHSATALIIDAPFEGDRPKADAMVTNKPGLMLGILTADCMPFLFVDDNAGVIGAAHAGWRGALSGILDNTIDKMISLGANPDTIKTALGPCLRQPSFEVGMDLVSEFLDHYPASAQFFSAGKNDNKRQFDLASFGRWRLKEKGVSTLDDLNICTLTNHDLYFSYRYSRQQNHDDYGRNLSAIVLRP